MTAARRAATATAAAVAVLVAVLVAACSPAPGPEPVAPLGERVRVEQGELLGRTDGDVLRWRGVPYAAPPVDELRWQAPWPAPAWPGVRPADAPGPRCPQPAAVPGAPHATAASRTEDCLTLDVTVPAGTPASAGLPVLVWVHGGGFNAGAAADVDPRRLAAAGPLVVVTVNYRLGVLGFLGLAELPDSGAFGLLDQQQALRWVQRNVAAFGGDPANVTLAGASAGADSVCSQMAAPAADGLFRRVVLQSGGCGAANLTEVIRPGTGPGGDTWKPLPLVERAGAEAAAALGCPEPAAQALACLRNQPVEALLTATGTYWSPAVGTPTLPRRPSELVATRELRPTPMLAGVTRDEGTLFTHLFFDRAEGPLTADRFDDLLADAAGQRAPDVRHAYPLEGRSPGRAWSDVITDRAYACPALATWRGVGGRAPLFAYEFADRTAPSAFTALPPDLTDGATHGAEMPYLFALVPGQPELDPAQQDLADAVVRAWARFATTGDPNGDGAPQWPRWTGDGAVLALTGTADQVPMTGTDFAATHHCDLWPS